MLSLLLSLLWLIALPTADAPWEGATPLPARGQVTHYAAGVMEWVYEYRLRQGQVPVCDPPACVGYVATLRPGDLGRRVWLKPAGRPAEGPFLVVDYAARRHFAALLARGLVAEVDYATAQRWGMQGPLNDVLVLPASPYTHRLFAPLVTTGRRPALADEEGRRPSRPLWLPLVQRSAP
ncbi:MAG: hypothetical protein NZ528_10695 [Caldilineales bacterium]|nr:hypothetical protein [Caldilineales bacterium]MDW8317639.1 hypothetical protein [Anaerolineae bacterium]